MAVAVNRPAFEVPSWLSAPSGSAFGHFLDVGHLTFECTHLTLAKRRDKVDTLGVYCETWVPGVLIAVNQTRHSEEKSSNPISSLSYVLDYIA